MRRPSGVCPSAQPKSSRARSIRPVFQRRTLLDVAAHHRDVPLHRPVGSIVLGDPRRAGDEDHAAVHRHRTRVIDGSPTEEARPGKRAVGVEPLYQRVVAAQRRERAAPEVFAVDGDVILKILRRHVDGGLVVRDERGGALERHPDVRRHHLDAPDASTGGVQAVELEAVRPLGEEVKTVALGHAHDVAGPPQLERAVDRELVDAGLVVVEVLARPGDLLEGRRRDRVPLRRQAHDLEVVLPVAIVVAHDEDAQPTARVDDEARNLRMPREGDPPFQMPRRRVPFEHRRPVELGRTGDLIAQEPDLPARIDVERGDRRAKRRRDAAGSDRLRPARRRCEVDRIQLSRRVPPGRRHPASHEQEDGTGALHGACFRGSEQSHQGMAAGHIHRNAAAEIGPGQTPTPGVSPLDVEPQLSPGTTRRSRRRLTSLMAVQRSVPRFRLETTGRLIRLGFIGTGEITSSIVTGLRSSGVTDHSIWLSPRNSVVAHALASRFDGVSVAGSNQEVLDHSGTIVVAVRPSAAGDVLSELTFRPDHQVISLVSALSLRTLSELVAPAVQTARAVPLPSAARQLSPTAIHPPDPSAFELFAGVGTVFPVEKEKEFEAICATTGTIAAYLALNETIASWLEQQGVPPSLARDYVARLFLGVAAGAAEAPERGFQSLALAHPTAGGINEQFLTHLVEHGLLTRVPKALDAVLHRIGADS